MNTSMLRFALFTMAFLFLTALTAGAQSVEWELLPGPFAGTVNNFVFANDGSLLAGTEGGGVFRSTDEGRTWSGGHQNAQISIVLPVTLGPDGAVFAGARRSKGEDDLWYSTDNGEEWRPVSRYVAIGGCDAIVTEPEGYMFATGGRGMRVSRDSGRSWTNLTQFPEANGIQFFTTHFMNIDSTGAVFAFGTRDSRNKIVRSTNRGWAWDEWEWPGNSLFGAAPIVGSTGSIFAINGETLLRSRDGGVEWDTLTYDNVSIPVSFITVFEVDREGALLVGTGSTGSLLRSTDDGESWSVVTESIGATEMTALKVGEDGVMVAALLNDGVYRSTDNGATWEHSMTGMNAAFPSAMSVDPQGRILTTVDYAGLFRSGDGGVTWEELSSMDQTRRYTSLTVTLAGTIFVSFRDGVEEKERTFRSTDDGMTWEGVTALDAAIRAWISPEPGVLLAADGEIWRSTDEGVTWETVMVEPPLERPIVYDMTTTPDGTAYAAARDDRKVVVLRSSDGGMSWERTGWESRESSPLTSRFSLWDIHAASTGELFMSNDEALMRSTDQGEVWRKVTRGVSSSAESLSMAVTQRDRLFLVVNLPDNGDLRKIVHSEADTIDWEFSSSTSFANLDYVMLRADSSNRMLMSTEGGGIYRYSPPASSAPRIDDRIDFRLSVAPSPTTGETRVRFILPKEGIARLDVLDMRGVIVDHILEEEMEAGRHEWYWEAEGLSSGAYLLRLTYAGQVTTVPLQIVR